MEIRIHNWSNGDVSNSRLILLRGCIGVDGCADVKCFNIIRTVCGSRENKWPVHAGYFKALVHLDRGDNCVELVYDGISAAITLTLSANDTDLAVLPVYVICKGHDGRFQGPKGGDNSVESARERISLGTLLVQCFFAEKLREMGFPRKTFQIDNDLHPKSPICHVFHSQLSVSEARKLSQDALWEHLGREIMMSEIGTENRKYLAFLSCTHWDGATVVADPALAGGGLALVGTGALYTWPAALDDVVDCFMDQRRIPPDLLDNSCFRGTFGGCFSTTLGGVCHEVGHVFNLGHTPSGIMSRGFDNIERVFLSVPTPEVQGRSKNDNTNNHVEILWHSTSSCLPGAPGPQLLQCKPAKRLNLNEDDLTSLTTSCATILAHHAWFNNRPIKTSPITYDTTRNILASDDGLKVVQIRGSCGSVIKSWELGSKTATKCFILPRLKVSPATLVAINMNGYILSQQIHNGL